MNKILIENIYIFFHYSYKSKKLKCQEEHFFLIIKIKRTRRDSNVNDDEENFNKEINLQNDKHDDSIDLDEVD